jgi:hypothetical protein
VKPGGYGFAAPGKRPMVRRRRGKAVEHYKIDDLLPPAHRAEFERLLDDPRTRAHVLRKWLRDHGCDVSFPTVNSTATAGSTASTR